MDRYGNQKPINRYGSEGPGHAGGGGGGGSREYPLCCTAGPGEWVYFYAPYTYGEGQADCMQQVGYTPACNSGAGPPNVDPPQAICDHFEMIAWGASDGSISMPCFCPPTWCGGGSQQWHGWFDPNQDHQATPPPERRGYSAGGRMGKGRITPRGRRTRRRR